jgi:hypothetical protein
MIRSLVLLAALGVLGGLPSQAHAAGAARRPPTVGARIAAKARQLVGVHSLHTVDPSVPDDCTGLVRLAYEGAGIELMDGGGVHGDNGVMILYRRARSLGALRQGRPKPGDIVFFRETYDRNRDGRRNDGLTHVGIVERVDASGAVTIVHRGSKGVARTHMNLKRPTIHREKRGEVVNDYLRSSSGEQRAYLTGELFAGFAAPEPWMRARRSPPRR